MNGQAREVDLDEVSALVSRLYQQANFFLPTDVKDSIEQALMLEESEPARAVLESLLENAKVAGKKRVPLCQDTGTAVIFAEIGQDVHFKGGSLKEAVDAGVAQAWREGSLRASMVRKPCFGRVNTQENTPSILHVEIVPGSAVKISVLPKGGGSENQSRLAMLKPADGVKGLKEFVLNTVEAAGASPCPPIFLGIGIGGTMDYAALLAKKALLRPADLRNDDPALASLEMEIVEEVNGLGIGAGGFGGTITCLGAAIEEFPCHIASFPVAVNIQCNSARRAADTI